MLRGLKQTREGIAGIAHWFSDVDAQFAATQQIAVSERVTDFIATIAATAEHGAIRVNVQPGEGDDGAEGRFMYTADTEQAIKDLSELAANIKKQEGILNDPDTVVTRVVVENDNFSRFRLLNPRLGTMVANIRPYGTRSRGDAQYEIGSHKKGVEASFGLLTNLHDPYGISPHADMRSFSLRFDREGHRPDVSALAPGRQATNQEGTVVADVASIFSFGDPNEPATRIGRAIAAGGRIRSRELGTPDSLNHNMLSDQSYGDADVFAALAQKVIDKFDAMAKTTSRSKLASVAHKLAGLRHHTDYQQAA